jgi:Ser/Thr protein kinase RdoA (MazF antagonist)
MLNPANSLPPHPPDLSLTVVAAAVAEQFGLLGDYLQVVSERDQNFRLTTQDGKRYVVKVTCLAQDPIVTDFQIAVLLHLEKRGVSGVPRIVRSKSGDNQGAVPTDDASDASLRIVTWIDGQLLNDCDITSKISTQFGGRLAELDIALQDFSHVGDAQKLIWDTQRAGELRGLLVHVNDTDLRSLLEEVLDDFDNRVKPALAALPSQVIHNDAHGENVLVNDAGDVTGIIDFGDMLRAPRIVDVSTAAAYLRCDSSDPMQLIVPFVAAYHDINPLDSAELELLFDLTRTRLIMTIILFYWRLSARPEDDPYRQKLVESEADACRFLRALSDIRRDAFLKRFRNY